MMIRNITLAPDTPIHIVQRIQALLKNRTAIDKKRSVPRHRVWRQYTAPSVASRRMGGESKYFYLTRRYPHVGITTFVDMNMQDIHARNLNRWKSHA